MVIRAIKTKYSGILFASTLEADWAKTLDHWGIVWSYEPEGLKLPSGQNYRCDFYLPRLRTWFEVKGEHNQRVFKPAELAAAEVHDTSCDTTVCGHSLVNPYRNVIVARSAISGKAVFEFPRGIPGKAVLLVCDVCGQRSFTNANGPAVCRRCRQDCSGSSMYLPGSLKFQQVAHGGGARRRKAS